MAYGEASRPAVRELITKVMQLTPAELRDFKRRFAQLQGKNGAKNEDEAALVQACKARLSAADERRLKRLIGKSERGVLRPNELAEYRTLVRRTESLDSTRLAALVQLARRWGKPVRVVMQVIGWEGEDVETTRHSTRPAEAGA